MAEILEIQKTELKIIVRNIADNTIKEILNVDLKENISIQVSKNIINIQNLDQRISDYSEEIVIPGTDNNNAIFSNFFSTKHFVINDTIYKTNTDRLNNTNPIRFNFNDDFNATMLTECELYIDGTKILAGTLQLKDIFSNEEYDTNYTVFVNGTVSTLFKKVSGKLLSDLAPILKKEKDRLDTLAGGYDFHPLYRDCYYTNDTVKPVFNKFNLNGYVFGLIDTGPVYA